MTDLGCSFCNELNGIKNNNFYEIYLREIFLEKGLNSRIVMTTKSFVVMPMVGPLVPGYLLIVPRRHCASFSELSQQELEEAIVVKKKIQMFLAKYYGKSIVFEHGAIDMIKRGGCCSDHAHLHIVATNADVQDEFCKYDLYVEKIAGIDQLPKRLLRRIPYLYYENQDGDAIVMDANEVESQFIRKLLAKKLGSFERAYWEENINYDWMTDIILNANRMDWN